MARSRPTIDRVQGSNLWLTIGLREGKNREVKRVLEHLGLSVNRLIRVSYGPFQLGDLAAGERGGGARPRAPDQLGETPRRGRGRGFRGAVREPHAAAEARPAEAAARTAAACASSAVGLGAARSPAPQRDAIRPTSDRLRESLFNILAHAYGLPATDTRVLDLFAGTGALGVEALSRGAAYALFVETGAEGRGLIRRNIEDFGLTGVDPHLPPRRHRSRPGRHDRDPFDLVFCDPPYGKGLGEKALASAAAGGWLTPDTLCVLEERANAAVALPDGFELLDRRESGDSQLLFARLAPAE